MPTCNKRRHRHHSPAAVIVIIAVATTIECNNQLVYWWIWVLWRNGEWVTTKTQQISRFFVFDMGVVGWRSHCWFDRWAGSWFVVDGIGAIACLFFARGDGLFSTWSKTPLVLFTVQEQLRPALLFGGEFSKNDDYLILIGNRIR